MASVWHIIRVGVCVVAGFTAAVCLFVAMPLAIPCGVVSLAFSQMPEA